MKKLLPLLFVLGLLSTVCWAEKLELSEGRAAFLTVPDSWKAAPMPVAPAGMAAMGTSAHYVTKSGSNDAVLITLLTVPDERFGEADSLRALVEEATQQFAAGSVEGKVVLKEFRLAGRAGFACTFTDANLVGKPAEKDNFKTQTSCYVYLGDHVMLTATIFSDDMAGKPYAEAMRLLKSISLAHAKDRI